MLPIAVIGPQEIAIIAVVVVVIFGGRKIPELARGLGEGINEFKKASKKPAADKDLDSKPTDSQESQA